MSNLEDDLVLVPNNPMYLGTKSQETQLFQAMHLQSDFH